MCHRMPVKPGSEHANDIAWYRMISHDIASPRSAESAGPYLNFQIWIFKFEFSTHKAGGRVAGMYIWPAAVKHVPNLYVPCAITLTRKHIRNITYTISARVCIPLRLWHHNLSISCRISLAQESCVVGTHPTRCMCVIDIFVISGTCACHKAQSCNKQNSLSLNGSIPSIPPNRTCSLWRNNIRA